jgi:3-deoxy-D-manno-octulosonic-acid transferase
VPVRVSGDTRFDRVVFRAARGRQNGAVAHLQQIAGDREVVVGGSTWREDEEILRELQREEDFFLLLAPHEPTSDALTRLLDLFQGSLLLSDIVQHGVGLDNPGEIHTVIVDSVGQLAELYQAGDVAWVGGGFGAGVHSLLEPAAHGLGTFSGPRTGRSTDAAGLEEAGSLVIIRSLADARNRALSILRAPERLREMGRAASAFVEQHQGATDRIVAYLHEHGYLPQSSSKEPVLRNE